MPEHEEHCQHSFKRYGIRGDDIHTWMDEPSKIVIGASHRMFRHSYADLSMAIQIFGEKYGDKNVENIFIDHLILDKTGMEDNREQSQTGIIWGNPSPITGFYICSRCQIKVEFSVRGTRFKPLQINGLPVCNGCYEVDKDKLGEPPELDILQFSPKKEKTITSKIE